MRTVCRLLALLGALALFAGSLTAPAQATPGPLRYPEYWFDQWNVADIWAGGDIGHGITVAVLDTGVQADVPGVRGAVLPGIDLTGLGGDGRIDRESSQFSHGTAMASIIVAHDANVSGIAPGAKILPVALPLTETHHRSAGESHIALAIRYAADHGAKVISMSFGGDRYRDVDSMSCPAATQEAVYYALRKGAVLVAAGGNAADRGSPVEEPSVCLGVLSVSAVDAHDHRASFSSRHRYLSVTAPGVDVVSLNARNHIYIGSGTSQATALTSGVLALLWSAHPLDSNRQVTSRLFAGLRKSGSNGSLGRNSEYGYGIVDARRSMNAPPTVTARNPLFDAVTPFLSRPGAATVFTAPPRTRTITFPPASRTPAAKAEPVWPFYTAAAAVAAGFLLAAFGVLRRRRRRWRQEPAEAFQVAGIADFH